MILDVDIGNTSLKWRLSKLSVVQLEGALSPRVLDELAAKLDAWKIQRVRVACVAGDDVEQQFRLWCERRCAITPEFAQVKREYAGLKVGYHDPAKLGVDRWLAMLAAYREVEGACAVIDAGSALTADFIDRAGFHVGGLIVPGVQMMREALFARTQGVKVATLTLPQIWRPGCDTVACVENGVAAVVAGLIKEVIAYGENQCGAGLPVLACGGDAAALAHIDSSLKLRSGLVLDGLALAFGDIPPHRP